MAYIGVSPSNGVRRVFDYTATAGQTSFSGSDNNSQTLSYTDSAYIDVYQNGVLLIPSDYTATTGTSVVLDTGATVSDSVQIVVYDVFSVADTVSKANGGTFESNISIGGTLGVTGATTLTGGVSGNTTFSGEIITSTSGTSNLRIGENAGDAIQSGGNYNTVVGDEAGTAITTADNNTAVGFEAGKAITTNGKNTYIGYQAGLANAGDQNVFIGHGAGSAITNGDKNTIVGKYNGNFGTLDLRTADNFIVLSDGDGYPVAVNYPPTDASYGNVAHWESHVKRTTQAVNRPMSIVIGMARISLVSGSATNISNGYFGSLVMVFTHAQSTPHNYQYTMLITHGWNSASVLFTNSYGGNTTTITASASSGVLRLTQSSGVNVEATVVSFLGSYMA